MNTRQTERAKAERAEDHARGADALRIVDLTVDDDGTEEAESAEEEEAREAADEEAATAVVEEAVEGIAVASIEREEAEWAEEAERAPLMPRDPPAGPGMLAEGVGVRGPVANQQRAEETAMGDDDIFHDSLEEEEEEEPPEPIDVAQPEPSDGRTEANALEPARDEVEEEEEEAARVQAESYKWKKPGLLCYAFLFLLYVGSSALDGYVTVSSGMSMESVSTSSVEEEWAQAERAEAEEEEEEKAEENKKKARGTGAKLFKGLSFKLGVGKSKANNKFAVANNPSSGPKPSAPKKRSKSLKLLGRSSKQSYSPDG